MATSVVCPSCGHASVYYCAPVTGCASCKALYPEELRQATEEALDVEVPTKPWFLQIVTLGTAMFGLIAPLGLGLAPFDIGSFEINGEAVSGPEFLRRAGLLFGLVALMSAVVAYGLLRQRAWTRPALLSAWGAILLAGIFIAAQQETPRGDLPIQTVTAVAAFALAAWYLYRKANVVSYFAALGRAQGRATRPGSVVAQGGA
jgi:hypothetical protein